MEQEIKSAADILSKRIVTFPSDVNMSDKDIRRNVIAAMEEYKNQHTHSKDVKPEPISDAVEENKALKKQLAEMTAGNVMFKEGVLDLNRKIMEERIESDAVEFAEWMGDGFVKLANNKWECICDTYCEKYKLNLDDEYLAKDLYKQFKSLLNK